MNYINQYRHLPHTVYLLSAIRAVISMGMMFVYPFLSLFLTFSFNYTQIEASYIVVIAAIISTFGSLIGGRLSDILGRKHIYIAATIVIITGMLFTGFLTHFRISILFIMCSYLGVSMVLPTISAMILDHTDATNKTECFSLMYLSGNIGSALGPIIAGALFYKHLPWIFYSMAIAFSLTLIVIIFKVKDIYVPQNHLFLEETRKHSKKKTEFKILFSKPILVFFIVCLIILTMCYINLDFMLPLQFSDFFGLNRGSKYSSMIWTINGIFVIFATPVIVNLTKKQQPLFNIGIAAILYALGFGIYGITHTASVFMITVAIWTSGEILISTCAGIYIADQWPNTHKGGSMSLYESSRSLGKLIGPVIAGKLLQNHSYSQAWLIIAAICVSVSILIWILYFVSNRLKSK